MTQFYAYVHAKPNGDIFYVGKGCGPRVHKMDRNNVGHKMITSYYGRKNILKGVIDCSSEDVALALEAGIIKCLRRAGKDIVNVLDGGKGATGYKHTAEAKKRISEAATGRVTVLGMRWKLKKPRAKQRLSAEVISQRAKRLIELNKARTGQPLSEVTKQKLSAALSGKPSPNKGIKQPPEVVAKRAAALRGHKTSDECRAKISAANKGRKWSAEQIKKQGRAVVRDDGVVFDSTVSASRFHGLSRASVHDAASGRQKTAGGHTWVFQDFIKRTHEASK